jgi:hypothetical protein
MLAENRKVLDNLRPSSKMQQENGRRREKRRLSVDGRYAVGGAPAAAGDGRNAEQGFSLFLPFSCCIFRQAADTRMNNPGDDTA